MLFELVFSSNLLTERIEQAFRYRRQGPTSKFSQASKELEPLVRATFIFNKQQQQQQSSGFSLNNFVVVAVVVVVCRHIHFA